MIPKCAPAILHRMLHKIHLRSGEPVSIIPAMSIDLEAAKRRLAEKRAELEEFSRMSTDARKPVALDQQSVGRLSRMDAMQQQAMAEASERARQRDLTRVEMAERRLKEGDYGYCVDCDEEIADRRLQIDPMAERCIQCAGGKQR